MSQGATAQQAAAARDDVRTVALRHAFVLAVWLAVFVALQLHLGLLLVPPVAFLLLPADRRAELLLAAIEGWPGVLADLLAILAAAAVGYAAGGDVRPVLAWAVPVIATYRTLSLGARAGAT